MNKKNKQEALERKTLSAAITFIESKDDGEKGMIEAYVSMFDNVDLGGDKIIRGAFADSLAKKLPKGVWMHDWNLPVAKTIEAREDAKGLYIKAQFNLDTQRGKDAYSDVKFGIIDEFSIGYRVLDHEWQEDGTRVLKKLKLYEWSPVLAGMNPDTELLNIKSDKGEQKVKYIKSDRNQVTVYFADGTKQTHKTTFSYSKYLKSQEGQKVDMPADDVKTILRIRQAVKEIDKAAGFVLRVTKKIN